MGIPTQFVDDIACIQEQANHCHNQDQNDDCVHNNGFSYEINKLERVADYRLVYCVNGQLQAINLALENMLR